MKKIKSNAAIKILGVFLLVTSIMFFLSGVAAVIFMVDQNFYTDSFDLNTYWAGISDDYYQYGNHTEELFEPEVYTDLDFEEDVIFFLYNNQFTLIYVTILSFLISAVLIVFLADTAGHHSDIEGYSLGMWDKIFLEFYLGSLVLVGMIGVGGANELSSDSISAATLFLSFAMYCFLAGSFFCLIVMTIISRFKSKAFLKTTLIWKILCLIGKMTLCCLEALKSLYRNLRLFWKAVFLFGIAAFAEMIYYIWALDYRNTGGFLFLWFLEKIVLLFVFLLLMKNLSAVKKTGIELAEGNLNYTPDMKWIIGEFKDHIYNLSDIQNSIRKAVHEQMKSERMKTELITNVSHDIKTPLTSIINYVDLLKKEDFKEEHVREYLEVLDRQSHRMKKMTEDLVEVSKASTGNVSVVLEKTNINVLFSQLMGEYKEKLQGNDLELIMSEPEENWCVLADGRLLWRIFENLFQNILKYALPGTRVYMSAELNNTTIKLELKNISRFPLNVSGEELSERFVRGDASRNTEGSGLGLSIAKTLAQIQKAELNLVVDGDLFKAILVFE